MILLYKKYWSLLTTSLLLVSVSACDQLQGNDTPAELNSNIQKISYLIGNGSAKQILSNEQIPLDKAAYQSGIREALEGKPSRISDEEGQKLFAEFQESMQKKQQEKFQQQTEKNQADAAEYFAKLDKDSQYQKTDSGIYYKIITAGKGAKPSATDKVKVHYEGKLIDGTVFDSSYERGAPASFGLNQVIAGWTEGLQLMTTGSTWELSIPADLAYGPGGSGATIGPHSALIFKVELIEIVTAEK